MNPSSTININRRECIAAVAAGGGSLALSRFVRADASVPPVRGGADHVISIWLAGGMGQIDTFDPKRKGDPRKNLAGSLYASIETAVPGVRVCEHLTHLAPMMDRMTAVRTVHHDVIDEH